MERPGSRPAPQRRKRYLCHYDDAPTAARTAAPVPPAGPIVRTRLRDGPEYDILHQINARPPEACNAGSGLRYNIAA